MEVVNKLKGAENILFQIDVNEALLRGLPRKPKKFLRR